MNERKPFLEDEDIFNQTIGKALKRARKKKGDSQTTMGKIIGVHQAAVCRIELGQQTITPYQFYLWCAHTGSKPGSLIRRARKSVR